MSLKLIKLDLGHFARLIHRSPEEAHSLAERKANEGLWRFETGPCSEAFVELPSSDLYHELEMAAGVSHSNDHTGDDSTTQASPQSEESIHHLKHENESLRAVLEDSAGLIEELRVNLRDRENSLTCNSQTGSITDELAATKAELVRAYDRIIDLQQQLTEAKQVTSKLVEDSQIVSGLTSLLARLDTRTDHNRGGSD